MRQAIDLQPEEPRAGQRHSDTTSLRVRLSRFNTGVLRVVAADVAGLPDSEQVPPTGPNVVMCLQSLIPLQGHYAVLLMAALQSDSHLT